MVRAALVNHRRTTALVAAIAIAVGIAACNRAPDKSASAKAELTPTAPAISPPPAQPAPVMPPRASAVFEPSASGGQPAAAPSADNVAKASDPNAKEPMTKSEESAAMPLPAQANDHSTVVDDGKK